MLHTCILPKVRGRQSFGLILFSSEIFWQSAAKFRHIHLIYKPNSPIDHPTVRRTLKMVDGRYMGWLNR